MNIEELLSDSSKLNAVHAASVAIENPAVIHGIWEMAVANKPQYSTRAANTIEIIDSKEPQLIRPYYLKIIRKLPGLKSTGAKRCLLKLLTRHTDISNEKLLCDLINFCFNTVISPDEEVAIKVYSVMILYEISKKETDLKNELIFCIKEQLPRNSVAFKSIGNKILKKLYKETACLNFTFFNFATIIPA